MTTDQIDVSALGRIDVDDHGGTARITVTGALTGPTADRLVAVCERAVRESAKRIELDLSRVTRSGRDGTAAVARCLWSGRLLEQGVEIVVSSEAGRELLLESLTSV